MNVDRIKAKNLVRWLWAVEGLLFSLYILYCLVVQYFLFQAFGLFGLIISAILAIFFGLKLLLEWGQDESEFLLSSGARCLTEEEVSVILPFFESSKMKMPILWVCQQEAKRFNAWAFYNNRRRSVAIGEDIMGLGQKVIYAVLSHEMAHFVNHDIFFPEALKDFLNAGIMGTAVLILFSSVFEPTIPPICIWQFSGFSIFVFVFLKIFYPWWYFVGQEVRADVCGVLLTGDCATHIQMLLTSNYYTYYTDFDLGLIRIRTRCLAYIIKTF